MSKSQLTKAELLVRVLKLKNKLNSGTLGYDWSSDQKCSADAVLNHVLDIIDEYRY
jgi:hypothetical protein